MNKHCWSPPDVKRVPKATIHKGILDAGLLLSGLFLFVVLHFSVTGLYTVSVMEKQPGVAAEIRHIEYPADRDTMRPRHFFSDFHTDGMRHTDPNSG